MENHDKDDMDFSDAREIGATRVTGKKSDHEKRYFYLWKKGEMSAAHHKMEPGNNVFLIVE